MTRGHIVTYDQRVRARVLIARADARIKSDLEKLTKEIRRPKTREQLAWHKLEDSRLSHGRYLRRSWTLEVSGE